MDRKHARHWWLALGCCLAACGSDGPDGIDRPDGIDAPSAARRLTVTIRGAGAVVGGVRSTPTGLDCAVAPGSGGPATNTCSAEFAVGTQVSLAFLPDGAARTAQFYIARAGADSQNCGDSPAATLESCDLLLDVDQTITVFPISVPPASR